METRFEVRPASTPARRITARLPDSAPHIAAARQVGTGRDALLMVTGTLIVALLNYALNIILGWSLPTDEYGRVGVSQTILFICVWFLGAGFPWVVSRTVAQAHGAGPLENAAGTVAWRTYKTAWAANTLLSLGVVGLLLLALAAHWLPLEAPYGPLILIVGLTVAALGINSVPDAGMQGLGRFDRITVVRILEAATNIVVSVALVLLGFGAAGALGGFAAAAILACALNIWFIRDQPFWRVPGWGGIGLVRVALLMTLTVFGGVLLTNIDLLALKFLSGAAVSDSLVGTYQVAAVLARAPLFVGTALVSTFYPRIAQETVGGRPGPAGRELLRWIMLVVLPMNLILVAGAPAVVLFFFPARFAAAAGILAVLGTGSAFLVGATAIAAILQAADRTRMPAVILVAAVALQLAILAWGVPALGALGAALSSAVASALACGLLAWQGRRLDARVPQFGKHVLALAGLGLLILPLTLFFAGANRLLVAGWVAAAGVLYLGGCLVLNLLDVAAFSLTAELPHKGRVGTVLYRLLKMAGTLNDFGRRGGATGH